MESGENYIEVDDKFYHTTCFRCPKCKDIIAENEFSFDSEGKNSIKSF